ncbi:hypothetical protein [Halorussus caseinilyticus]|uniref:Uncharacterized protein n=1 Tax=Halorussus caseinilyticus TaxID=3034025 RepID=A0ABD5WTK2_9EURY
MTDKAEFTFGIRCPVECRVELLATWVVRNIELVVGILSLLVAFFGRKKIWNVLRLPPESGTGGGEQVDATADQPPDE